MTRVNKYLNGPLNSKATNCLHKRLCWSVALKVFNIYDGDIYHMYIILFFSSGCGIVQFYMYKQDGELSPIVSFMFDDERVGILVLSLIVFHY